MKADLPRIEGDVLLTITVTGPLAHAFLNRGANGTTMTEDNAGRKISEALQQIGRAETQCCSPRRWCGTDTRAAGR